LYKLKVKSVTAPIYVLVSGEYPIVGTGRIFTLFIESCPNVFNDNNIDKIRRADGLIISKD